MRRINVGIGHNYLTLLYTIYLPGHDQGLELLDWPTIMSQEYIVSRSHSLSYYKQGQFYYKYTFFDKILGRPNC